MVITPAFQVGDEGSIPFIRSKKIGAACTKAGENALQAICGGFNSHLLHTKNKNMKQMKINKEVLSGSFDSSKDKLRRDANDHVFKFIIRMIKRRKQKLKAKV